MNRELKKLIERAAERGWTQESLRNNHIRLRHEPSGAVVIISSTPSDGRALKNIEADLRRAERSVGA